MATPEPVPLVDGRRARRDRNRESVVDALLAIYAEGNASPTLDEVAARSGISHRSVFRYFEDLDELHRVAVDRHFRAIEPYFLIGPPAADHAGRIDQFVAHRFELYERTAPVARVARRRAHRSTVLSQNLRQNRARLRAQAREHFAADLEAVAADERGAVADALTALVSLEAIDTMRDHQGRSAAEIRTALTAALHRLLAPTDPTP